MRGGPLGTRLRRSIGKNADEAKALMTGQMPGFVVRRRAAWPDRPPVFVFHDVDPDGFSDRLGWLSRAGFRTLDADAIADVYERGPAPEGEVGLTFDDATWTFWAYAFPLLRRFGFRAVLFVVPGVVPDAGTPRPGLEDVWSGACTAEDVLRAGRAQPFCSWPEIERMHASGLVDVQSHSLSHARIPVSPRVVDFQSPGCDGYAGGFDIPVSALDGRDGRARSVRPGAPVFESASRLSGRIRFVEDAGLSEELMAIPAARGAAFFDRPGWRRELRRIVSRRPPASRGRYETPGERDAALRREIVEAGRLIEDRLPGHRVRHLAYPWHDGSALADRLAAECGYRSVHYGAFLDTRPGGRPEPIRVRRLPERYLERLPGPERIPLWQALTRGRRPWRAE